MGQVSIGLTHHTGIVLELADGSHKEILLPSRTGMTCPAELAQTVSDELRRRISVHDRGRAK